MKYYSFTPKVFIYFFLALGITIVGTVFLALVNDAMSTKTVLQTWPGTKSVCARQQYNYSLKITQCVEHRSVPATCKKVETAGPIFDAFVNTNCE
jgi:hypothetical protein